MYCGKCGKELKAGASFCNACGTPAKRNIPAAAAPQPAQSKLPQQPLPGPGTAPAAVPAPAPGQSMPPPESTFAGDSPPHITPPAAQSTTAPFALPPGEALPSLFGLKCPSCGSPNWMPLGEKGAAGKAMASSLAFGAAGNMVAGRNAAKNLTTEPLQAKAVSTCGNKI